MQIRAAVPYGTRLFGFVYETRSTRRLWKAAFVRRDGSMSGRQRIADLRDQNFEIEVTDTGEAYVKASRLALSRALRNLFINAATHGVRGIVSVTGGAVARIAISDQGPGIPPDVLDQVFEPFFRADRARSQNIPGVGLGLTISREIIRRDGGEIRIANRPCGSLVQVVELPRIVP